MILLAVLAGIGFAVGAWLLVSSLVGEPTAGQEPLRERASRTQVPWSSWW